MNTPIIDQEADFTLVHEFNAPKETVFKAFGNAEALNAWWGPAETKNSVIKLDFRPGGIFHFKMESQARVSYGRFLFGNINPYDLLEFTNAFADAEANVIEPPFNIPLPREIFYRFIFTEHNGKTTITMTAKGVKATPEQTKGLKSIRPDMQRGFGATFNQLSLYLDKEKAICEN